MYESGDEPCNGKNPDDPESPNSAREENMVSQATANSNVNSVSGGEVDGLVSNEDDGKDDINSKLDEFYAIVNAAMARHRDLAIMSRLKSKAM